LMLSFPGLAIAVGSAFDHAIGADPDFPPAPPTRQVAGAVLVALLVYGGAWRADYLSRKMLVSVSPNETQIQSVGLRIRDAAKPGDTLFVKDEPYLIYMYAHMPPMTRFIYPESPAPGAVTVWANAVQRKPTFIVISHGTQERMPGVKEGFEADLAKMLAADYELWLNDPIAVVYRRTDHAPATDNPV
jgi:hypothetical protein